MRNEECWPASASNYSYTDRCIYPHVHLYMLADLYNHLAVDSLQILPTL